MAFRPAGDPSFAVSPALHEILTAVAENRRDAYPLMAAYGRDAIVKPAYERAERVWAREIRPAYGKTLSAVVQSARNAAASAPAEAAATAADLRAAADALEQRKAAIDTVTISHDTHVDASLDSDWWFTVQGKAAYAGAVIASIRDQLDAVLGVASGATADIQRTLTLQARLQDEIKTAQDRLKEQFTAQRSQLASLSGFGGALPVDLASFIGLFPLVLGLVLGLLLLRAAEERRQAALAAADLAGSPDAEPATRQWLIRQALGASGWLPPAALTLALALAGAAWVWFAGTQVQGLQPAPVLRPETSALLGSAAITAAALWDIVAVWRLARARV
ncbi:MAG: hypothetical protein H6844_03900 [Alphaproteobacteria bacterium]|nr:hypothetical protein [Alphaproteobacteria bacterium]